MNSQVKPEGSHGKQILLIGYEWSSIAETKDLEAFEMAFLPASQRPVGFPYVPERHYGKVNMLTVEGNVRGVYLHEINPDEDEVEEAIWLP